MLASQQFCVKWNSYSSNLQNVFPRLLTSEHFVDITLACEGQMIKCHKVVLSACSTYFEKLLVHNPCQHPIIFMKDMKHWEIQALVDFMYKGEVNVSQDELNSLLVAAEALQIRGLCGSDSVNRSTQDVNRHGQSNTSSAGSRVPSVSLPHDTVLSGGTAVGRESPPFKRRRPPNEEKEHSQIHHTSMPRIANITSTTSNSRGEVNSLTAPQASAVDHTKTDGFADEIEDELPDKKPIKQELDMDDNFLEGDLDADGPDEDYGSLEHQEDSDSNNREEVPPHSPLDQPGPSGLAPPCSTPLDKAATVEELFNSLPSLQLHTSSEHTLQSSIVIKSEPDLEISNISTSEEILPDTSEYNHPLRPNISTLEQILLRKPNSRASELTVHRANARLSNQTILRQAILLNSLPPGRPMRHDQNTLRQAASCVVQGVSLRQASDQYQVPRTTLYDYMKRHGFLSMWTGSGRRRNHMGLGNKRRQPSARQVGLVEENSLAGYGNSPSSSQQRARVILPPELST